MSCMEAQPKRYVVLHQSCEGGHPTRDMDADIEEAGTSSQPPPAKRQQRYTLIHSCLNAIYLMNLEFGDILRFMVDLITI